MPWNILCFAFAVNGQQPDFVILLFEVVDNPDATTFASSCHCPTKLSHTTRTRNNFSRFRIPEQEALEAQILIIGQVSVNIFGKSSRLYKFHNAIIRLCRTNRKGQPFLAEKRNAIGKSLGTSYIAPVKRKSRKRIKPSKTMASK